MKILQKLRPVAILIAFCAISPLWAQGTSVAFGNLAQDRSLPVDISSDQLAIDQETGEAVFTGNVLISQGEMRLNAPWVKVLYGNGAAGISRVVATGGVTLVSGEDAAEAQNAEYDIDVGKVVLIGDVLMTQGPSVLSSERAEIDLESGTAALSGRVRTTIVPAQGD